ncbi:hypothetical protein DFO45_3259 [Azorhizobium sp. AG788]|uniref:hypothetical protein n=1 Tax=Azorhizobium sp. AG788 TaxID=2183897 RepID=UPI00105CC0D4|nr:hypothetical protein [Azorhizobium sp. AG788]TDT92502.1 hypothetical protein DFO45_3259 [Azorhizobium sp. AG788]
MPSDAFRADDIALPTFLATSEPLSGHACATAAPVHTAEQREAVWLQWEEHWLTELALRVEAFDGCQH